MRIGFTGTKEGMTWGQKDAVRAFLDLSKNPFEENFFDHGDCIGSDAQAAQIARDLGYTIIGHPPINDKYRAFFDSDIQEDQKEYLDRNRDIVDAVDHMLATPKERDQQLRSGTWMTIRYTRRVDKPLTIVYP